MTRRAAPSTHDTAAAGGPYLSAREAQVYLGFSSVHAFHLAYVRLGIRCYRLGRSLRFRQADLDAAVRTAHVEESTTPTDVLNHVPLRSAKVETARPALVPRRKGSAA